MTQELDLLSTTFVDWDGRPGVRFESGGTGKSFAVLGGAAPPWASVWTRVDDADVCNTGYVVDLDTFRGMFGAALPDPLHGAQGQASSRPCRE